MPSAAAPRAPTPLPVSRRSETGAVTRPKSDGASGPITRRSGALGGGDEAGRGPRGAGSLREAQPLGGPARGREVAGPRGVRRTAAVVGSEVRPGRRPGTRDRGRASMSGSSFRAGLGDSVNAP
ncbi:collagen alpha-2(I) chain-like [Saccopteryx bilineata]|uniref:collagen alpha-2(I) chain-like n=1 Tax=Saccopteryx bilineata TaxID=59482 RepID=UPI00338F4EA3